ncbi:MAG: general stress protein [Myxococcota bacterium]
MTGIFSDPEAAERAVRELIETRFASDEISIVVRDREGSHEEEVGHDTGVAEGAVGGAAIGGVVGAIGATLAATGVVATSGFGVLAAGPLLAALKGAVAGGAVGLEVGALAGLGFWKDEAHIHAEALDKGGIIVAVPAEHEHAEQARKVFTESGADAVRG